MLGFEFSVCLYIFCFMLFGLIVGCWFTMLLVARVDDFVWLLMLCGLGLMFVVFYSWNRFNSGFGLVWFAELEGCLGVECVVYCGDCFEFYYACLFDFDFAYFGVLSCCFGCCFADFVGLLVMFVLYLLMVGVLFGCFGFLSVIGCWLRFALVVCWVAAVAMLLWCWRF